MLTVRANGSVRNALGGAETVEVTASTIRELLARLADRFPALERELDTGIAVAINGEIYRDDWDVTIPEDGEVFLLPRIPGG